MKSMIRYLRQYFGQKRFNIPRLIQDCSRYDKKVQTSNVTTCNVQSTQQGTLSNAHFVMSKR